MPGRHLHLSELVFIRILIGRDFLRSVTNLQIYTDVVRRVRDNDQVCTEACQLNEERLCSKCKCQATAAQHFARLLVSTKYLFSRAMKAITDDWIALEDEEDEEEGEGEEVMREIFAEEEEDEETDIESDGEAVGEVHELF